MLFIFYLFKYSFIIVYLNIFPPACGKPSPAAPGRPANAAPERKTAWARTGPQAPRPARRTLEARHRKSRAQLKPFFFGLSSAAAGEGRTTRAPSENCRIAGHDVWAAPLSGLLGGGGRPANRWEAGGSTGGL